MRTLESAAMSLVTVPSGICKRNCCVSPRPRRSMPTTSLSGLSAGISSRKLRTARSINTLASSDIATASDLVPPQQLLADDHALDLGRSLADEQQRRVAIQALDLVIL